MSPRPNIPQHCHCLELHARFIRGAMLRGLWTHQAHFVVAIPLIATHGPQAAFARISELIIVNNTAMGIINSVDSGYHATLTAFYVRGISPLLVPGASFHQQVARVLAAPVAEPAHPFRFYARERLLSAEYRMRVVECGQ